MLYPDPSQATISHDGAFGLVSYIRYDLRWLRFPKDLKCLSHVPKLPVIALKFAIICAWNSRSGESSRIIQYEQVKFSTSPY